MHNYKNGGPEALHAVADAAMALSDALRGLADPDAPASHREGYARDLGLAYAELSAAVPIIVTAIATAAPPPHVTH